MAMDIFGNEQFLDPTAGWLAGFNASNGYGSGNRDLNAGRSNQLWGQLTGAGNLNPQTWLAQAMASYGRIPGTVSSLQDLAGSFDPMAGLSAFQAQDPGLRAGALDFAEQALAPYRQSTMALGDQQSNRAYQQLAQQLAMSGGLQTGAGLRELAAGTADPLYQALQTLGQAQAGLAGSTYNTMAPQILSQLGQGFETLYRGQLGAGEAGINALLSQGQGYASAANPLLALLGAQGEQQLLAPSFMENPDYWSGRDFLGAGLGLAGTLLGIPGLGQGIGDWLTGLGSGTSRAVAGSGATPPPNIFGGNDAYSDFLYGPGSPFLRPNSYGNNPDPWSLYRGF